MTTMNLFFSYWNFNTTAFIIALLLSVFHFATNGYKLNKKSYLYFGGIFLFILATFSPLAFLAQYLFSAHMIKHIIILLIIPPMLLSSTDNKFLNKVINISPIRKIGDKLFYPITAWLLGVGSMWLWHIPKLYKLMQQSQLLQTFQMISLLILGLIFIWPVFTPTKYKKLQALQASLYLFTACVGCTILGIFITFAPANMYAQFLYGSNTAVLNLIHSKWGITSEIDQQMGGLIMWIPACFVYLTNVMISLIKWYSKADKDIYKRKNLVNKKLNLS